MRAPERLARVQAASVFTGGRFEVWRAARIVVAGAGALGSRLALEIVRSGARVVVVDPDVVEPVNLGTQQHDAASVGRAKVDAVVAACAAVEPGRAAGLACDVRAVGADLLAAAHAIVDCTDDPALVAPLVALSNGFARPLLRVAVDGSGRREVARIAVSHGGAGHACALCAYGTADLAAGLRTPCPGGTVPRAATTSSAGTALTAVGLGLLTLQRLVAGDAAVLDRELHVDLDGLALLPLAVARADRCLSGHESFEPIWIPATTADLTVRALLQRARDALGRDAVAVAPLHAPLALAAHCACGARTVQARCLWSPAPACVACGASMHWRRDVVQAAFDAAQAGVLGILDLTLADLGLPDGALFTARTGDAPPVRFVLRAAGDPFPSTTTIGVHA